MTSLVLYRIAAGFLALGALAHTLGGMLRTARQGPGAGPQADEVLASMRAVRFVWRGSEVSWFGFWMGNGLGLSALLLVPIVGLWVLGGLDVATRAAVAPIAWTMVASLALLTWLGVKYFATKVGVAFGLVAVLALAATILA